MPPKRSQQRQRAPTSAAESLSPRRSRRLSTVHSTLSTRSTLPTATETSSMATSQPSGTVNSLHPDLIQTLVSTVTAEVTKKLLSIVPAQRTSSVLHPASPFSIASPEIGAIPTSLQLPGGSVTNLIHGAIAAGHASISRSSIQATGGSQHESFSNRQPPVPAALKLANIITHLTKSSLRPSSIPSYTRAWKLFTQFQSAILQTACFSLPIFPATLAPFIAYLFERK